jgi:hypothetical protein
MVVETRLARQISRLAVPALIMMAVSTVPAESVKRYGAIGNAEGDDAPAIQAAIDATAPGGTVTIPAGRYRIRSTLHLRSNITYKGINSPVLLGHQGGGSNGYLLADGSEASNVRITGIVFDGGGISFAPGKWTSNITITGNTFQNIVTTGPNVERLHAGIYIDHVSKVYITDNRFYNIIDGGAPTVYTDKHPLANGIKVYHASHLMVTGNTMEYMGQGISISAISPSDPCDCRDIKISGNKFNRVFRMAIEIQGGLPGHPLTGLVIDHNTGTDWLNPYADTFGISLAAYSVGAIVSNNYFDAFPSAPNDAHWRRYGYCLEIGGKRTLVQRNTCVSSGGARSWGWSLSGPKNLVVAIAGNDAIVRYNTICDGPGSIDYEPPHPENSGHAAQIHGNSYPACGHFTAGGIRQRGSAGKGGEAKVLSLPALR